MMENASPNPVTRAVALAFVGFTLWTLCDAAIRYLKAYPVSQLLLITAIYSLVAVIAFAPFLGGIKQTFQKPKLGLQIVRGLILTACNLATFIAFTKLELPTAYAIVFLSPIAAKIISIKLNHERVAPVSWLISLVGFAGVLLVLRPGSLPLGEGEIAALCIPILFSLGLVLGRTIGEENQTKLSMTLFTDLALVAVFAWPAMQNFVPMAPFDFLVAVFIGTAGVFGMLIVSVAYARAPAAYVAPVHYTQIVLGTLWGVLFFGEFPDGWTMAGAALIIGAGLALVWRTRKMKNID